MVEKTILGAAKAEIQTDQCGRFCVAAVRHGKEQRRVGL